MSTLNPVIYFVAEHLLSLRQAIHDFDLRDATQSPGKSPIFSPLKKGGGRGVKPDFGKIETKDSNCRDRASVSWEN